MAQERAEAAIRLATEQGFAHEFAVGTIMRGWALAEQGQVEEGIAQIRQGLDAHQARGQRYQGRLILPCWPRRMGKRDRQKKGSPCSLRH